MKGKIIIAGGSGLIGQALTSRLIKSDYEVVILSRDPKQEGQTTYAKWDTKNGQLDPAILDGAVAVVNLAGAGIVDKRWTDARKEVVMDSRIASTRLLVNTISQLAVDQRPKLINASAIGHYGDSGDAWVDESTATKPVDFLSEVTHAWENEAKKARDVGIPVTLIRIGLVLSLEGGAFPPILQSVKMRVGGYFGSGKQYYSYIHMDDLTGIFQHAIENDLPGAYNAVGDHPVTNKQLVSNVAEALHRTVVMAPIPSWTLKLAMGEMAIALLNSNRVSNQKIKDAGYKFRFQNSLEAAQHLLSQ